MIRAFLTDLDGVIRIFPPAHNSRIEEKYNFAPGSILATAFAPALLQPAITGLVPDEIWRERIAAKLRKSYPRINCQAAVKEWSEFPGEVDQEVLWFLRSHCNSMPLALLTNATSRLEEDLRHLDILRTFDLILSSSLLGRAKPDRLAFEKACQALNLEPEEIYFLDDSPANVEAAREFGMQAKLFQGLADLKQDLEKSNP